MARKNSPRLPICADGHFPSLGKYRRAAGKAKCVFKNDEVRTGTIDDVDPKLQFKLSASTQAQHIETLRVGPRAFGRTKHNLWHGVGAKSRALARLESNNGDSVRRGYTLPWVIVDNTARTKSADNHSDEKMIHCRCRSAE